jgi:hypothetical protein
MHDLSSYSTQPYHGAIDKSIDELLCLKPNERAHAWIIGRQLDGDISATIFGQFTKELYPPASGWTYMGRNVKSTVTHTEDDYEIVHGHVFPDEIMEVARLDTLTLTEGILYDNSLAGKSLDSASRVIHLYIVSGCTLSVINGRYYPCGVEAGSIKYRNVRGWILFRAYLSEIPELGIFIEGCYDINAKGPSLGSLADTRAMVASNEIVVRESDVIEGTADFMR